MDAQLNNSLCSFIMLVKQLWNNFKGKLRYLLDFMLISLQVKLTKHASMPTKETYISNHRTYPLTLVSSTAKVFIAPCILSKLVLFQTKSTLNPWFNSTGTPWNPESFKVELHKTEGLLKKNSELTLYLTSTKLQCYLLLCSEFNL
jgi:hypothetical protein